MSNLTEKARAAVVAALRPELVEMGIARIDQDDDGDLICDSPEVLDGAARRLANRAVEAVAGLLASHPVTDETVERVARAMWHDEACRYHDEPLENWSKVFPEAKGDWVRLARAAIEALGGQR